MEVVISNWKYGDKDIGSRVWMREQMENGFCFATFVRGQPVAWIICYRLAGIFLTC